MVSEKRLEEGQLGRKVFAKFYSKEMEMNLKLHRNEKTGVWTSELIPRKWEIIPKQYFVGRQRRYKCSKCAWTKSTRGALLAHINKVHTFKILSCETCNYKSYNVDCFNKHRKVCGKKFYCKICGKQFPSTSAVNRHVFVHQSPKHQCDKCRKKFTYKFHAKSHKCRH